MLPCIFVLLFVNSLAVPSCELKECERWIITIVPMFTESFSQINVLHSLTNILLEDCEWYLGYVHVFFLDKYGRLRPLVDPSNFDTIDENFADYKFTENETASAYIKGTLIAIQKMPPAEEGNGRYIFAVTDFEQTKAKHQAEMMGLIDNELISKGILFRTFSIDIESTNLDPSSIFTIDTRTNAQGSNILSLQLRETQSVVNQVRPCKPLTVQQKLAGLTYEKRFHLRYMILHNPNEFYIGMIFFGLAMILAIGALLYKKCILDRRIEYKNMKR
ncbi:unnamed protein product [Bursaphelenchus okinawaensis]|uniref:Uncharacterized protein n=1 Tax=Bursaphelenchus okinawaensis TaxID=465554 RepID=A0A811LDG2_9BILA|nr:unnamed protein product [Bursaphelenchus okinawaensis]CAG9121116.1 unnamed protein product [Bursaphelenchus okinawaensis]